MLAQTSDLHFPAVLMNLEAKVRQFKGVVAQNHKLVNIGNSVRIRQGKSVVSGVEYVHGI